MVLNCRLEKLKSYKASSGDIALFTGKSSKIDKSVQAVKFYHYFYFTFEVFSPLAGVFLFLCDAIKEIFILLSRL